MWHYCATPIWPCPLFLWSWLCTFAGNRLAYISPVTSSKSNPGQITCECVRACLRVHVCGKGEGLGSARSSSERFAQHIACHCPIWKKFHASHVISLKLRCVSWRLGWLVEVSFFRSDKIFLCVCVLVPATVVDWNLTAHQMREDWWKGVLSGWMSTFLLTEADPRAESAQDYCSPRLRDGSEATEANMTPVIRTWLLFYNRSC